MSKVLTVLVLSLGVAAAANAGSSRPHSTYSHESQGATNAAPAATPASAPEIDPASAVSAFTLLAGGLVMIRGRRSLIKRG